MNNHIKEQKEQTITNTSSPLPHKDGKGDKFTPILFLSFIFPFFSLERKYDSGFPRRKQAETAKKLW